MKKVGLIIITLVTIVFSSSCKKESTSNNKSNNILFDESPEALADSLVITIDNPNVLDAGLFSDLQIISFPEILELDYFAFSLIEGPQGGHLTKKDSAVKKCSDEFKITKDQKAKLNQAFLEREHCMKAQRDFVRGIDHKIEEWAASQRIAIIEKYKLAVHDINLAFQNGKITESQKKEMLANAEKERNAALANLKSQVQGKLKDALERAVASGKIKDCEKIYLQKVREILGDEKFEKWVKCHKWHYRRK